VIVEDIRDGNSMKTTLWFADNGVAVSRSIRKTPAPVQQHGRLKSMADEDFGYDSLQADKCGQHPAEQNGF
jgi:hypothetical protein